MTTPILNLTPREQAILSAVADAFFPPAGPIPVSGTQAGIVPYFDRYLERSGMRTQILMRLLFTFTDMSPLVFGPKRRRFTKLDRDEQIAHLQQAFVSRVYFRRVSFVSLRAVMTMAYLANETVAAHMNMRFDADPFGMGPLDEEDMGMSGAYPTASGVAGGEPSRCAAEVA